MTGELSRKHWRVPVHGLSPTDPDGIVHAVARRDGTVNLHVRCGDSGTTVRLDIGRAAQLSTGIWEAAGTAQHLTGYRGDGQSPPPQPLPTGSADLPDAWHTHLHRTISPQRSSAKPRLTPVNDDAAREARRTIGLRLRRIRQTRGKSLEVIAGLVGMSTSSLHHVEYGRRELTLSEIAALAHVLQIDPATLIILPILTPTHRPTDTTGETTQTRTPGNR